MPDKPSEMTAAIAPRMVTLVLKRNVTPANIQAALERMYKLAGCRACGLNGFDVRLRVIDPEIAETLRGLEGVAEVGVTAGAHF